MTLISAVALFFAMLVSALIPGPSVMAVVSRSIVTGVSHGLVVVLGVLIADFIFICIALSGLLAVSSLLGELAIYIKYVGASYLIWLAYLTWKAKAATDEISGAKNTKLISNGIAGFFIGISNPKAILFYMGFFPAFIELSSMGGYQVLAIILIEVCAVGGVLAAYAYAGSKARYFFQDDKAKSKLNKLSSGILASCGVLLLVKV